MLHKKNITAVIFILILFAGSIHAQTVESLINDGDKYTDTFDNNKALESYQKADKLSPDNWQILWRISRAYVNIGTHMPATNGDEEDAQLAEFEKALDYSDRSVNLAKDKSVVYVRRAVVNGRIALFQRSFYCGGNSQ